MNSSELTVGSLVLGPTGVTYDGRPIALTPTELAVLRFLAESRGKPLPATTVAASFPSTTVSKRPERMLKVVAHNIRRKAEEVAGVPLIATKRGQSGGGYYLRLPTDPCRKPARRV